MHLVRLVSDNIEEKMARQMYSIEILCFVKQPVAEEQ